VGDGPAASLSGPDHFHIYKRQQGRALGDTRNMALRATMRRRRRPPPSLALARFFVQTDKKATEKKK